MRAYQRILVPIESSSRDEVLLKRAAEIAQTDHAEVMVVRVIDVRSGFESDGPAGVFPMERAARKKTVERKRLDLMLSRNSLSWAQAQVTCGEPVPVLTDVINQWRPDLIVTASTLLLPGWVASAVAQASGSRPDLLNVVCDNVFSRLAQAVFPFSASQARSSELQTQDV